MNLHRIFQISKGLPPDSLHYMIFARKLSASPTETVTISGYPCVLENSVEKPVVDYRIYGNTVQNGTPSPDNPVEIQSVGDLVTDGEYAGKYKIPVVASTENNVPKTTNIYLDEPLRKIGDYADVIDFERGVVERNIKKVVFDGSEEFKNQNSIYDSEIKTMLCNTEFIDALEGNYILSSHFTKIYNAQNAQAKPGTFSKNSLEKYKNYTYYNISNKELNVVQSDSTITKVSAFRSYLSKQYDVGTPVTAYYALAESRTEILTLPQLPTLNGTTIITTDTEIKPSDIKITYKARKSK